MLEFGSMFLGQDFDLLPLINPGAIPAPFP